VEYGFIFSLLQSEEIKANDDIAFIVFLILNLISVHNFNTAQVSQTYHPVSYQ